SLDQPETLEFVKFFRHLLREILCLAPIFSCVVKFPDIIVKRNGRRLYPRRHVLGHSGPTLVVDSAIAKHFKVLRLVSLRGFFIVERVQHADAFDRILLHTVHKDRLWKSSSLKDRRRNIDDVSELRSNLAFCFDPLWPMDDRSIPRSAKMRGYLL